MTQEGAGKGCRGPCRDAEGGRQGAGCRRRASDPSAAAPERAAADRAVDSITPRIFHHTCLGSHCVCVTDSNVSIAPRIACAPVPARGRSRPRGPRGSAPYSLRPCAVTDNSARPASLAASAVQ